MCVYNFALTQWYNLKIKWSRDENFQTRIIQLKLLLSSDLLHLRPVTVRKPQKLIIHSLGKKDRLTGLILITRTVWVVSAHLKHCSVGLEILLCSCRQPWRSRQLLGTRKKGSKRKDHIWEPSLAGAALNSCGGVGGVACSRDVRYTTSVWVKAPAPRRREVKKRETIGESAAYRIALRVLDRSHYSTSYAHFGGKQHHIFFSH